MQRQVTDESRDRPAARRGGGARGTGKRSKKQQRKCGNVRTALSAHPVANYFVRVMTRLSFSPETETGTYGGA